MKRQILSSSVAVMMVLAARSSSLGGTVSFTGTGTSWNQATDWSPALPTSSDDILFSNGFATTLDGSWLVRSLSFNVGSGTVSIDANATGTASRTLVLSGDAGGSDALGNSGMLIDLGSATTGTVNIGVTNGVGVTSVALGDNGAFNISNASATLNFGANSNISGAVNVSQSGAGTLILAGTNTFGGAGNSFTLLGGTLDINNASALGNSANTFVVNGGTIDNTSGAAITTLNYAQTWAGSFTFNGTNALNLGTGAVALTSSPTVTVNGSGANGTLTVGGVISGAQSLTKAGTGTLVLTGANTYTGGTNVNAGTLLIGGGGATGSISANSITVALGATLAYNYSTAFTATPVSVAGNVSYTSAAGLTLAAGTYGGNKVTATGNNVIVGGNLNLNAGASGVSISGTSNSAAGVTSTTSRSITATGNVTITGTSTAGSFVDGISLAGAYTDTTGTLTFVGTAGSTGGYGIECGVSGSWAGTISTFGNVVFDGTGGTQRNSDLNTGPLSGNGTVTLIGRLKGLRSNATFTASGGLPYNVVIETTGSAGINGLLGAGTDTTGNGNYTINSAGSVVFGGRTVNAGTGTISLTSATGYSVTSSSSLIGGTLTMGDTTGIAISSGATLTLNATGTIPNVISGSGNITVAGGTITFGAANTYTGTTKIGGGTLNLDFSASGTPSSNIISSASALVTSGGTLVIAGSSSAANMQSFASTAVNPGASSLRLTTNGTSAQDVALNLGVITRNVGGTLNFTLPSGTPSATNGIIATGNTGDVILTGGGVPYATVAGGSDWAAMDPTSTFIVGLSTISGGYTPTTSATLSGNADVAAGVTTTTLSTDTGITSLRFNQPQATTVDLGSNTLTAGGILVTQAMGNNPSTITGGTLQGQAGLDVVISQNNTSNALTISSVIADNTSATGLTKAGAGQVILTGTNTYTGLTAINGGTLQVGDGTTDGSISASSGIKNNGTLVYNITGSQTFTGVISGSGALTMSGPGTLTLTGANTYTGGTNVNAGTLNIGNGGTTGSISGNSITVASGATLAYNYSSGFTATPVSAAGNVSYTSAAALTLAAGTYGGNQITATGTNVVVGGNLTLNAGAGGASISGTSSSAAGVSSTTSRNITATGNVTITGTSTAGSFVDGISLAGAYTDTTGTLTFVGTAGAAGAYGLECGVSGSWAGTISTFGNVVFDGTGGTTRNSDLNTGNLSGNGTVTLIGRSKGLRVNDTFTASGGLPYNVVIETTAGDINGLLGSGTDTTGNGNYTINSAGSVVFGGRTVNAGTGAISLTSATGYSVTSNSTLKGGTLTVSDTNGVAISSGATLTVNAAGTIANVISGAGNMAVAGGAVTLGGANTYTGTTTVSGGTLVVSGSISGSTNINGGTLAGTGAMAAVNINSGGTLAPGPVGGTGGLFTTDVKFNGGTLAININTSTATSSQQLANGNLTLGTGAVLALNDLGGNVALTAGTVFDIVEYAGSWDGGLFQVGGTNIAEGGTFTVGANRYQIDYQAPFEAISAVTLTVIPEPCTLASLVGGFGMLAGLQRFRRRRTV